MCGQMQYAEELKKIETNIYQSSNRFKVKFWVYTIACGHNDIAKQQSKNQFY